MAKTESNKKSEKYFRAISIGGNERNCPSIQSGKPKKTWRLFL